MDERNVFHSGSAKPPCNSLLPIIKKTFRVIGSASGATNERNIFHSGNAKTAVNDSGIPRRNRLQSCEGGFYRQVNGGFGAPAVEAINFIPARGYGILI
ncbi:MAG: hypothetical protein LBJ90_00345 [Treponema sp.]|jgi:hypothetical protein|nr:hypothetical protein [Treponema sp.]